MRLFIAIPIASAVRADFSAMQERLAASDADVKWVEPENYHLTVRFIGDFDDERVGEIEAVCVESAASTTAFDVSFCGVRTFPRGKPTIKTIFAGVDQGIEEWKRLVKTVEMPLSDLGVPHENGMVPHITLGRVRSPEGLDDLRQICEQEANTDCGWQIAEGIELVSSYLDPRGAIYRTVAAWTFNNKNLSVTEQK